MTIHLQYSPCLDCKCGRTELLKHDSNGENIPALALVGQTLKNLEEIIDSVRNATELLMVVQITKEKHGIPVLIWTDYTIQIPKTPGLCKRTHKRLRETFERVEKEIIKESVEITETVKH